VPPRLIEEFDIPDEQLVAKARSARMISPSGRLADMPIQGGFVGMVDREHFDEFLRGRAGLAGAHTAHGYVRSRWTRDDDGRAIVNYPHCGFGQRNRGSSCRAR
jgi:geranylgeranyl reductase